MADAEKYIVEIQYKVQLLLKQHATLQKENARLRSTLQQMEENETVRQDLIQSLTHQNQILKASLQDLNPEEKKQFLSKINSYLKDIDTCISLLSK